MVVLSGQPRFAPAWWTIAHSEDVCDKPVAIRLGAHELVALGAVRATEG